MVMLPGAHYSDPEFSWKFGVAPAGIGFMDGRGIGPQYDGDLFVGAALSFSGFFMLDRSLALRLKTRTVGCLGGR